MKSAKFGPQIVLCENESEFFIRSRSGIEVPPTTVSSVSEIVAAVITTYYLLDLTYPSCFAQPLGCIQEIVMKDAFAFKSKKTIKLLTNVNDF